MPVPGKPQRRKNGKSDWYVWADPKPEGTPPNNWLSVFYGPCWTWDGRRGQYYLHNFLPSQPQSECPQSQSAAALFDTARFWLARGVDGFRLDAINFAMHDPIAGQQSGGQEACLCGPNGLSISSIICITSPAAG
jgi:alpha-glucosidase